MNDDYILLQEDTSKGYEPTSEEILEEAKYLGIESDDTDYLWIAKEALRVFLNNLIKKRLHYLDIGNHINIQKVVILYITMKQLVKLLRTIHWTNISDHSTKR